MTATVVTAGPVTQGRVLRSEWIKLKSVRSTVVVTGLTIFCLVGLSLLVSYLTRARWNQLSPGEQQPWTLLSRSLIGVDLAQLTVGALGVVVITGEYTTGMIRATLGAVPKRLPVLWAKLAVFTVITFAVVLVSSFAAFLLGQAVLGSHGVALSYPGALRAVFGVSMYVTVVGILGVALGFLIRNTAGGVTAVAALVLVLPEIIRSLPSSWADNIYPYLPSSAGQAVFAQHSNAVTMGPWSGFALFCGYTAVAILAAAWALRRRDA
ncbi:MAG: ABC transporter permease subunit [Acidimicrobiaceae bacterium]|nr:ABC transporter permease subunit [Acidimicrobiaceae bacterium]